VDFHGQQWRGKCFLEFDFDTRHETSLTTTDGGPSHLAILAHSNPSAIYEPFGELPLAEGSIRAGCPEVSWLHGPGRTLSASKLAIRGSSHGGSNLKRPRRTFLLCTDGVTETTLRATGIRTDWNVAWLLWIAVAFEKKRGSSESCEDREKRGG